ncbi:MAG: gliding motility-associated lipoprotein [Chitinophagaceae bacterium]|nr:MAG: gliding motility-associated lipoprotein [Chitinophagaceae bacterium]
MILNRILTFVIVILITISTNAQKSKRLKNVVLSKSDVSDYVPLSVAQIPTGTFINTASNKQADNETVRPVLVSGFYISESEITNAQYKEFVNWVRDSIAAKKLGGQYVTILGTDTSINWKNAEKINYNDANIAQQLGDLMLDPSMTVGRQKGFNPEKIVYLLEGFNYQEAVKKENKGRNPNDFVYRMNVNIYPDTLCWMRDFGYSNNEQMAVSYFSSVKYQNHPVVGVSWKQATAFCDWMTKHKINVLQRKNKLSVGGKCRLPTETEWLYAAKLNQIDKEKESEEGKVATEDSSIVFTNKNIFPVTVNNAHKGKIGLYNLTDNVMEWTNTSYYEGGENFTNRFNPDIQWGTPESESKAMRRKVIRGGSWKDTPKFLTTANRSYDDMDATHSYLGFRIVVNLPEN